MDEKSYQGIYEGYKGTNQYKIYNPQIDQASVTWDPHCDEVDTYDNKNLQEVLAAQA